MAVSKKDLNELIKHLSNNDLPLVYDFLKRLTANTEDAKIPYDDEPLTEGDIKAINEANIEYEQGKTINLKELENELRG